MSITDLIRLWKVEFVGGIDAGTIAHGLNGEYSRRVFCATLLADHMEEALMPSVLHRL